MKIFWPIILVFCIINSLFAQQTKPYNLSINNGLPSNHVYWIMEDKLGYLWITTDRGLVRYNGYECRVFNLADGLPSEDVWGMLEDKKGRIWLGNISDELGYMYQGKYHTAYINQNNHVLYPREISCYLDGVIFHSDYSSSSKTNTIFYTQNDSLKKIELSDSIFGQQYITENYRKHKPLLFINNKGKVFCLFKNTFYQIDYDVQKRSVKLIFLSNATSNIDKFYSNTSVTIGENILNYNASSGNNEITIINLITGKELVYALPNNEAILYVQPEKNIWDFCVFNIFTKDYIYECHFEDSIKIKNSYSIQELIGDSAVKGFKASAFVNKSKWAKCLASNGNGVYINYKKINNIFPSPFPTNDFVCVGNYKDSLSFWWNKQLSIFATFDINGNFRTVKNTILKDVRSVSYYSGDTFFINCNFPFIYLSAYNKLVELDHLKYGTGTFNSYFLTPDDFLIAGSYGFSNVKIHDDTYSHNIIDYSRYNNIVYNNKYKTFIISSNNSILFYDKRIKNILSRNALKNIGINGVKQICTDEIFGNTFVRGYDNISLLDLNNYNAKMLFSNFKFKDDATMLFHDDKLIVVWKYGVLFSAIVGYNNISEPYFLMNTKCVNYNYVNGTTVLGNILLLNTDKGLFKIEIPNKNTILENSIFQVNSCDFILNYNDSLLKMGISDTIVIKTSKKILLDIIFPGGNGKPKFYYKINKLDGNSYSNNFTVLNSNEINIPDWCSPDNFYKVYFYSVDDAIKSDIQSFTVYILPKWWQTNIAQKTLFIGALVVSVLIIMLSVYITKRIVLRAQFRKNLQMELELKSIHAQINPHFIFNTLNSALLLVSNKKMDEAYTHISRFSKLLRAYLKSSRNKYITINEEVNNLKNYLDLQQTRFKDKFDYQIILDNDIDPNSDNIPSLLIQPFAENALNHGILHKDGKGNIIIEFKLDKHNKSLVCIIDDDGVGRKKSKEFNKLLDKKESYGDLLINDLVKVFNKYEDIKIDITYIDKQLPLNGTTVTITINNKKYG